MMVTNQDPATWVAATPGSAAWRRTNDGLFMRPSFTFPVSPRTICTLARIRTLVTAAECAQLQRYRGDLDRPANRAFGDSERSLRFVDRRDEVVAVRWRRRSASPHPTRSR